MNLLSIIIFLKSNLITNVFIQLFKDMPISGIVDNVRIDLEFQSIGPHIRNCNFITSVCAYTMCKLVDIRALTYIKPRWLTGDITTPPMLILHR